MMRPNSTSVGLRHIAVPPVVFMLTFWAGYLTTERNCPPGGPRSVVSESVVRAGLVGVAVGSALALALWTAILRRRITQTSTKDPNGPQRVLANVAVGLGVFFVVAILAIGLPALAIDICDR